MLTKRDLEIAAVARELRAHFDRTGDMVIELRKVAERSELSAAKFASVARRHGAKVARLAGFTRFEYQEPRVYPGAQGDFGRSNRAAPRARRVPASVLVDVRDRT